MVKPKPSESSLPFFQTALQPHIKPMDTSRTPFRLGIFCSIAATLTQATVTSPMLTELVFFFLGLFPNPPSSRAQPECSFKNINFQAILLPKTPQWFPITHEVRFSLCLSQQVPTLADHLLLLPPLLTIIHPSIHPVNPLFNMHLFLKWAKFVMAPGTWTCCSFYLEYFFSGFSHNLFLFII